MKKIKDRAKHSLRIAHFGQKNILTNEGGVEVVVRELTTRMAAQGHIVTCYNRNGHHVSGKEFDEEKKSEYKGVTLKYVYTINCRGLAAATSSISASIRTAFSDYDVVHIHAEGPAFMCWLPKLFGKKVICTIHGLDWQRAKWGGLASKYIKMGERQAVKHADEIIVLSKGVQDYFMKEYGRKTVYIPNGVTRHENRIADEIKNRWELDLNSYVLFLGRIVPEKGLKYLVEAWKGIETDKKLVIAGGTSDTDEFVDELKRIAPEVIWTGFVQGNILEELYSNSYVYVLPSDLEGMPLSLLEAMSYGNCCLVSDIDECASVVADNAVTFRKSDEADLREKLQNLLDDEEMVKNYKQTASEFICDKYNWDDVVGKTLRLYR